MCWCVISFGGAASLADEPGTWVVLAAYGAGVYIAIRGARNFSCYRVDEVFVPAGSFGVGDFS